MLSRVYAKVRRLQLKCNSLGVVDVLLSQFGTVKPVSPAQMLADEGDGHGCLIWIQLGHVQVIHKVDQLLGAWRPIVDASLQQMTQSHQLVLLRHWLWLTYQLVPPFCQ